jgi:hypothetical protein
MDAVATADEGNKIASVGSEKTERIVLSFPCLDQRHQHIEAVSLSVCVLPASSSRCALVHVDNRVDF